MAKRIVVWILIAGFLVLVLNLIFWQYQVQLSVFVYAIVVVSFLLSDRAWVSKTTRRNQEDKK